MMLSDWPTGGRRSASKSDSDSELDSESDWPEPALHPGLCISCLFSLLWYHLILQLSCLRFKFQKWPQAFRLHRRLSLLLHWRQNHRAMVRVTVM